VYKIVVEFDKMIKEVGDRLRVMKMVDEMGSN